MEQAFDPRAHSQTIQAINELRVSAWQSFVGDFYGY